MPITACEIQNQPCQSFKPDENEEEDEGQVKNDDTTETVADTTPHAPVVEHSYPDATGDLRARGLYNAPQEQKVSK